MASLETMYRGRGVRLSFAELLYQLELLSFIPLEPSPELLNLNLLTHAACVKPATTNALAKADVLGSNSTSLG